MRFLHKVLLPVPARTLLFVAFCIVLAHASEPASSTYKLGERFFGDQLYSLALEHYQKYLDIRETTELDPLVHFKIALCYYKMENFRNAAEAFEEYLRNYPNDDNGMEATWLAAESRNAAHDYREASEWYLQYWKRYVGSARAQQALLNAADCAKKAENAERAIDLYSLYVRRFSKHETSRDAALVLASLLIKSEQYPRAKEALDEAQGRWKDNKTFLARLLYYKASLARAMQKPQSAFEHFEHLAKLTSEAFPEKNEAYRGYIDVLLENNRFQDALPVFKDLQQLLSQENTEMETGVLLSYAETARKAKEYGLGEQLYVQVLSRELADEERSRILYRLAECQAGTGEFTQAIETLRRLADTDSTGDFGARALLKMGDLYFANDLLSSTITVYRRYLRLPTDLQNDRVIFRIGSILQNSYKQYGAAIREYETILRQYGSSQYYYPSLYAIAECLEAKEEYESALRQYEHLIESCPDDNLSDQAAQRAAYLRDFHLRDAEGAALVLAEITEATLRGAPRNQLSWKMAEVYERYLRRYDKALEVYEAILAMDPPPPDTLKARASVLKGKVLEKLYSKAQIENAPETASYMKEQAVKSYSSVIDNYSTTEYAADASYGLMMLNSPNVADFEAFLQEFPESRNAPHVLLAIANHYEKRANDVDRRFAGNAADAFRAFVEQCPNDSMLPYALSGLARNLIAVGKVDTARAVIEDFLGRFPESDRRAEMLWLKGKMLKIKGDHQNALLAYRELLTSFPFTTFANQSRYEMALAQLHTGQVLEAFNNLKTFLQEFPDGESADRARFAMGICLTRIGRPSEAAPLLRNALQTDLPEAMEADGHYELARMAEDSGDVYKAIDHYKKALAYKQYENRSGVLLRMGNLCFEHRIYDEAAEAYGKAREVLQTPQDTLDALTGYIASSIMNGKGKSVDKEITLLKEKYEQSHPDAMAKVLFYEGLHLLHRKDYDRAANRFQYVMEKYAGATHADQAAYHWGLCAFYDDKPEEAMSRLKEFLGKYPQSGFVPQAKFKIAMILHGQDQHIPAAQGFKEVTTYRTADNDTRFRAAYNAAISFQKTSAWDEAADMYRFIGEHFPARFSPSALNLKIGFCMVQASRYQDALRYFQMANKNPEPVDKPEIVYWIATCHSKLGEHRAAIAEYLKVPYLYSDAGKWGITAELEAARLYERMEEFDNARTLYKKIVQSDGERGRFGKQALSRLERLNNLAN